MKVFLDTSVLVAAILEQHPDYERAFSVLEGVQNETHDGVIAAHSLAETYSTLTRIPAPFRHSPEQTVLTIDENILKHFKTVSLSGADYASAIRDAARLRIQGGTIYDALLLKCAGKEHVDRIYTFNLKHFQAIAPPRLAAILCAP